MTPQQNTFAALHKVQPTSVDAQERIGSWLPPRTCADPEDFRREYLEPAPEPETTPKSKSSESSLSSESNGVLLKGIEQVVQRHAPSDWVQRALDLFLPNFIRPTSVSSISTDTSTSHESDYSYGVRSPRQPSSLRDVLFEQSELDEIGSGYEGDVSDNADSSRVSSMSSDASSAQYMPVPSSSESSSAQYTPAASSSGFSGAQRTPDTGSSDSSAAGSPNPDSEARDISSRFEAITSEHHEQTNALRARAEGSNPAETSLQTLLSPVASNVPTAHERLAQLEDDIDLARQALHTRVNHSYGDYRARVVSLEALEREQHEAQQQLEQGYHAYYRQFL